MAIRATDANGQVWEITVNIDGSLQVTQASGDATLTDSTTTTAATIIAKASQDARKLVDNSADATLLVDYVDRIHKELLRLSRFRWLLSGVQQFSTADGVTDYWIGPTADLPGGMTDTGLNLSDVYTIKRGTVFDRTNYQQLFPTGEAPLGSFFEQSAKPRLWRNDVSTPGVVNIYPVPNGVYTVEFRYFKTHNPITLTTDVLQVPDQYTDIVVAGVNELVALYLKQSTEAAYWHAYYESGKKQIIRDMNLFPRGPEFVRPDSSSTTSNMSGGLPTNPIETSIP
jgi:hypothetical protein